MDISLYFHVPFCQKKCPYCHFFSFKPKKHHVQNYMQALFLEWKQKEKFYKNTSVVSIYFGGGTPTFLQEKDLEKILNWISFSLPISPSCEITIETIPLISNNKIANLKKLGFNRISMGAISFEDKDLITLGRIHRKKDIFVSLEILSKYFDNISIDLLYDIPFQKEKTLEQTLSLIKHLPINHISLYNLTFEPKTPFYKKKEKLLPFVPKSTKSLQIVKKTIAKLKEMGFERYEISAFAKNNKISLHNIGYWIGRSFLGFGPSAFSFFHKKRFQNYCNFQKYLEKLKNNELCINFEEKLKYPNNLKELLAIQLRMIQGVDLDLFQKKWDKLPKKVLQNLKTLQKEKLLAKEKNRIFLTEKGLLFYDEVASSII